MTRPQLEIALDRPLPQNPEAERAVLGSILINPNVLYRISTIINTGDFFNDKHRAIFGTILALSEEGHPIDLLTVKEDLMQRDDLDKAGGSAYISSLVDGIPDVANVERYARIVREHSLQRQFIIAGNVMMGNALDWESPQDLLANAERAISEIAEGAIERGFVKIKQITRDNIEEMERLHRLGYRMVTGIPTGFRKFDEFTSGFRKQNLILLAARPGCGKTSLAMDIAELLSVPGKDGRMRVIGDRPYNVGVFSLEMSKEELGMRALASEAGVNGHLIRTGMLSEKNWIDLGDAAIRLSKASLWIDDTAAIDLVELRAKAKQLKMDAGLDIIFIDYLQLMSLKGKVENRQQEVSKISRGLKQMAKELDIPIVALSQLSRRTEERGSDHRPQLSDLRESGSLEQDADMVCFIYRDELYNKDSEDKGLAEIIIGKQRNGPIGDFKLVFRNDITRFFDYEEHAEYAEPEPEPEYQDQNIW